MGLMTHTGLVQLRNAVDKAIGSVMLPESAKQFAVLTFSVLEEQQKELDELRERIIRLEKREG
jgi:hypothetical protein